MPFMISEWTSSCLLKLIDVTDDERGPFFLLFEKYTANFEHLSNTAKEEPYLRLPMLFCTKMYHDQLYAYIVIYIYIYIYIYICICIALSLSLYIYIYIYICSIRALQGTQRGGGVMNDL